MTTHQPGDIITVNNVRFRVNADGTTTPLTTDGSARPTGFAQGQVWTRDGVAYLLAEGGYTAALTNGDQGCVDWEDDEDGPHPTDIFHGTGLAGITAALRLATPTAEGAAPASHPETGNTFRVYGVIFTVQADGTGTTPEGAVYPATEVTRYLPSAERIAAAPATTEPSVATPQRYRYGGSIFTLAADGTATDESGNHYSAATVQRNLRYATRIEDAPATTGHPQAGQRFRYNGYPFRGEGIVFTVAADGSATDERGNYYTARTVARHLPHSTRVNAAPTPHANAGQRYVYGGIVFTVNPDGSATSDTGQRYEPGTVTAYLPQSRRLDPAGDQPAPRPGEQYTFSGVRYLITDNGGAVSVRDGSVISPDAVRAALPSATRVTDGETYRVRYSGRIYTIHPDGSATDPSGHRYRSDMVATLLPHALRL